jgi:hypothetical protein
MGAWLRRLLTPEAYLVLAIAAVVAAVISALSARNVDTQQQALAIALGGAAAGLFAGAAILHGRRGA